MTIEGDYTTFAHLETVYLGVLARRTLITTNTVNVLRAANSKPVIFMPAPRPSPRADGRRLRRVYLAGRVVGAGWASRPTSGRRGGAGAGSGRCHTLIASTAVTRCSRRRSSPVGADMHITVLVDFENDPVDGARQPPRGETVGRQARHVEVAGRSLGNGRLGTSPTG
jgi:nicotinate phosphoribosyltransferase